MVLGCEGDNPNSVVVPLMYSSASAQKASVEQASSEIRRVNTLFERCSPGFLVNLAALSSRLRGSLYQNDLHLVTLRGGDLRGFRKELSESLILFVQLCAS